MWPFKKKPKLIFVETESAEQKRLKQEQEENNRQFKLDRLKERNIPLIKEAVDKAIMELVEDFKVRVPQPFQIGDMVSPSTKYRHTLGWLGSGASFIRTFDKEYPDVNPTISMPVAKIWVDTGSLKDSLDPQYSRYEGIWKLYETENPNDIEKIIAAHIWRFKQNRKEQGGEIVEWAIDFDWAKLNIKGKGKDKILILQWGGFPANTFDLTDSDNHRAEVKYYHAQLEYNKAKQEYDAIKSEYDVFS